MIWTKHESPLGHDVKPYYMQREAEGSLAEHYVMRERVRGPRGMRTRWALYYLMNRGCELIGHFETLGHAKATANMRFVNETRQPLTPERTS